MNPHAAPILHLESWLPVEHLWRFLLKAGLVIAVFAAQVALVGYLNSALEEREEAVQEQSVPVYVLEVPAGSVIVHH